MLEFLTTTRAQRRLRAQEQEQEKRMRCRDEREGLKKERLEGSEEEAQRKREAGG